MDKELDNRLCEKYPEIFANRHGDMRTTAMCWGFECGEGWYHIIDALCGCMQDYVSANSKPQVVATQVKEKYGTLRFYYDGGDDMTDGMVWMAERLSSMTCEVCGAPGETMGRGWITTRCPEHSSPRKTKEDKWWEWCPKYGGPADNGHDRCYPPNPYYCTKCQKQACDELTTEDGL